MADLLRDTLTNEERRTLLCAAPLLFISEDRDLYVELGANGVAGLPEVNFFIFDDERFQFAMEILEPIEVRRLHYVLSKVVERYDRHD